MEDIIMKEEPIIIENVRESYNFKREKIIDKTGTMHRAPTGITLIALIITIIVLLILAGVALNFVLGENGILKHAEFASNKYENKAQIEQNELAQLDDYISNGRNTVGLTTANVGYKILFNGIANENSKEYELTDSIENYNFLIIEGNIENGSIYETNTMTIPIINMEYCKRDYYILSGIAYTASYGWDIQFSFSTANKLYVFYTRQWGSYVPRITKIIGIKMPEI